MIEEYTNDPAVLQCARWLEAHGFRFCLDFGWRNAVDIFMHKSAMDADEGTENLRRLVNAWEYDRAWRAAIEVAGDVPTRRPWRCA